jgi:hypothetical protein
VPCHARADSIKFGGRDAGANVLSHAASITRRAIPPALRMPSKSSVLWMDIRSRCCPQLCLRSARTPGRRRQDLIGAPLVDQLLEMLFLDAGQTSE